MKAFKSVFKRELRAYFASPLAYVFMGVYLLLSGLATWNIARFFDTARVDHLSVYGYTRDTTPVLRDFAQRGVRFDSAYAPSATTAPSSWTCASSRARPPRTATSCAWSP